MQVSEPTSALPPIPPTATLPLAPQPVAGRQTAFRAGSQLCREGRFEEALRVFALGIRCSPGDALLYFCFGTAAHLLGNTREAKAAYRAALLHRPDFAEAHLHMGNLLYDEGGYLLAAASYWKAIESRPKYAKAYCNLGNAMLALGRTKEAVACLSRALVLDPVMHPARHNLGNALLQSRSYQEAEECFRKLLEVDPETAVHTIGLGNALLKQARTAEAEECYRKAVALHPDMSIAHANLANALLELGHRAQAKLHARRAIELDSTSAGANYNLALSCLREGNYREGWQRHEFRWSFRELRLPPRKFPQPQWKGAPLAGRTILLHAEQGLGDTLQFVRYLPLLRERGAKILLEVQPSLKRLMEANSSLADQTLARGERLPSFDLHCPLMSLPLAFETTLESIPCSMPYLQANPEEVAAMWRTYPRTEGRLRVGLVWAGNPNFKRDPLRSIALEALLPLAALHSNVDFFSLQHGEAVRQMEPLAEQLPLIDASSTNKDFATTAAQIATLDLILSVDTAVAHLAGAMGLPVWILLPCQADWRWLEERHDSPWYPSARLFRQPAPKDWGPVVRDLHAALQSLVHKAQKMAPNPV